jgi:hypothetical protein
VAVPAGGIGIGALSVGSLVVCQLPGSVLFDPARSFVGPDAATKGFLADLVRFSAGAGTQDRLLLVGHTDTTGGPSVNDPLSERRAQAVHAVLIGDAASWEQLFAAERWSVPEFSQIVVETRDADPADPAAVTAAATRFRDGSAADRAALFTRYFDKLLARTGPPPILFVGRTPPRIGCGETHPLRGTAAAPGRDPAQPPITGDFRPNRRTEAFFFTSTAPVSSMTCPEYPNWTLACVVGAATTLGATDWFVSISRGTDAPGRGTRAAPFRTINFAISRAVTANTAGRDVVHVMDGTYIGPLPLVGGIDVVADTGAAPIVTLTGPGTIVSADGVSDVKLTGMTLRGTAMPAVTGPSGLVIKNSADIVVTSCTVTGCSATRGGGILVQGSQRITISGCTLSGNRGDRGGGIALLDSSDVSVIDKCIVQDNTAGAIDVAVRRLVLERTLAHMSGFEFVPGDSHGGGIYIEGCTATTIRGNTVTDNRAILFGGGIAIDNRPGSTTGVTVEDNTITCNQVSHRGLPGIPAPNCTSADLGDPLRDRLEEQLTLFAETIANSAVELLHGIGAENGIGGGIALRHVTGTTRLVRNRIGAPRQGNRARRGGGVECFVGAYPELEGNTIEANASSADGGGVSIDQFDPFLPATAATFLGFSRAAMFPRRPIRLIGNTINANTSFEDGGGLYATGGGIVEITGATLFTGNAARENGGGVRVSYAVRLTVRDATFRDNRCNTAGGGRVGGGGLAARNADVQLEACRFDNNTANAFAGGAVYVNSAFEGGFDESGFIANQSGQFDAMMNAATDLDFHARHLTVRDCTGSGNEATGASGAGGFLYAVRTRGTDGGDQPLIVAVSGPATAIGVNTSAYQRADNRGGLHQKRGNVVFEFSGPAAGGGPAPDVVNVHSDVAPVPTGVAVSVPAPDGQAVVFIPEPFAAPPSRDVHPTTFPFASRAMRLLDAQPRFGPRTGRQPITLTGEGFVAGSALQVLIDGRPAGNVVLASATRITAETPAQPPPFVSNLVDVELRNGDGQAATLTGGYEYADPPTLALVNPQFGVGGDILSVIGTGFRPRVVVRIDGVDAAVTLLSSTALDVVVPPLVPPRLPGTVDVEVENDDGQSDLAVGGFTYV